MTRWMTALLVSAALMLAGCDWIAQRDLKPGVSTVADVRALMGRPETIWEEPDGTQVYEYPRAPFGTETFMVVISPAGIFQRMDNVLTPERFAQVRAGMIRDDVRRLLGRASETIFLSLRKQEVWSFRHKGAMGDKDFFNVYFDTAGRVVGVDVTRDPLFDGA